MQKTLVLLSKELKKISQEFSEGRIVCLPTDTVYAISCDATNVDAIKKIYRIKNRPIDKTLPIFVSDINMARMYAQFRLKEEGIAKIFWPGAITFVSKINLDCTILPKILINNQKIALRIPESDLIRSVCRLINRPIIATSANISSKHNMNTFNEIKNTFYGKVDLIVRDENKRNCKNNTASTIIEFLDEKNVRILRTGIVLKEDLNKYFNIVM